MENDEKLLNSYRLFLIVFPIVGFFIRVSYVYHYKWGLTVGGDYLWYRNVAALIAKGQFFVFPKFKHQIFPPGKPTALHPPLYPLVLAFFDFLGFKTIHDQLVINCLEGAFMVFFLMLAAKEIYGVKASVIAGALSCCLPSLLVYDGVGLSEQTEMVVVSASIILAYKTFYNPSYFNLVFFGILLGLSSMARSEQILMVITIGVPLFYKLWPKLKRPWLKISVFLAGVVIIISPWLIRNLLTFNPPETFSSQLGITLETANCNHTYYGALVGYWDFDCYKGIKVPHSEAGADQVWRNVAIKYIKSHFSRFLEVIPYRIGRILYLYNPFQQAALNQFEGWPIELGKISVYVAWTEQALAIVSIVILARKKIWQAPLVAQIILVLLVAIFVYGNSRYRSSFELVLVLYSSIALTELSSFITGQLNKRWLDKCFTRWKNR